MNTVTGQNFEEDNANLGSGEVGPKTTGSGPIPPYLPSASGALKDPSELVIRYEQPIPVDVCGDFLNE